MEAEFVKTGESTRLSRKFHSYPLKIAKPFSLAHGQLGVYVMDASPGMMAGDRYKFKWELGEGAHVYATNQSMTKVHPSRKYAGGPLVPSVQQTTVLLRADSLFEYIPEPVMLYKDAALVSHTEIRMEAGSALIVSEILCPGRMSRGELFQFDSYKSKLSVFYNGETVYSGRQNIQPASTSFNAKGGWNGFTHLGSLCVFREGICSKHVDTVRDTVRSYLESDPAYRFSAGVSLTYKHGLVLNVLGTGAEPIQRLLRSVWGALRLLLFGLPPLEIGK
ncbi:urease accessory protein UreD [Paenibacillus thalictri]|nr:urease accessory protein UreD [Paenibacillus thalictri]